MKIYLQNPEKTQIQVFETENERGAGFITWIKLTEQEITAYELQKAKDNKLSDLDNYHDSDEVRNFKIKTPKNLFIYSTLPDARNILVEQIDANRNGIECGLITIDKAGFLFFQNGEAEFISLNNLKIIYAKLMEIVNKNFTTKLIHKVKINAITSLQELESYDFKTDYLTNQIIKIT
jgi:hypothetical protein